MPRSRPIAAIRTSPSSATRSGATTEKSARARTSSPGSRTVELLGLWQRHQRCDEGEGWLETSHEAIIGCRELAEHPLQGHVRIEDVFHSSSRPWRIKSTATSRGQRGHALRRHSDSVGRMANAIITRSYQIGSDLWTMPWHDKYPTCKAEHVGSQLIGFRDRFAAAQTVDPSLAMHVLSRSSFASVPRSGRRTAATDVHRPLIGFGMKHTCDIASTYCRGAPLSDRCRCARSERPKKLRRRF